MIHPLEQPDVYAAITAERLRSEILERAKGVPRAIAFVVAAQGSTLETALRAHGVTPESYPAIAVFERSEIGASEHEQGFWPPCREIARMDREDRDEDVLVIACAAHEFRMTLLRRPAINATSASVVVPK